jgi:MATE family multidrug resistance protein
MPISLGTAFALNWNIYGLWTGVAIALALVTVIEGIFIQRTNWREAVDAALARNSMA